jgi:hypothetical protein
MLNHYFNSDFNILLIIRKMKKIEYYLFSSFLKMKSHVD